MPRVLWNSNLREGSDPVRRPVPAVDPRAGDLRACGKARRALALGHLTAQPPLGSRNYHHGTFLARAIRVVCPRAVGRKGRCPCCGGRGHPPGRDSELHAKGRGARRRICTELFNTQRLSDASFAEAVASLGETGLIEVIGIIGYYTLIGNTLNVFQLALPEGVTPPFPE